MKILSLPNHWSKKVFLVNEFCAHTQNIKIKLRQKWKTLEKLTEKIIGHKNMEEEGERGIKEKIRNTKQT